MPGVALHFTIAERTLETLIAEGESLPFDPDDPDALNAFFNGAIGPDLGYFPGGFGPLSDLSHCVRSGALTKVLVRTARTELERAFAWGWLTHVLADRWVHPWIGRGVGELIAGRHDTFVDGSSAPLEHLRVEMGVDAWFAARSESVRARRLSPLFDASSIGWLSGAYASVYGIAVPPERFLASHRAASLRASQGIATIGLIGALMDGGNGWLVLPGVRWLLARAYESAPLRGTSLAYLNPVRPTPWLLDGIDEAVQIQPALFLDHLRTDAADLADFNLDTGELSADESEHAGTERALEALEQLMRQPEVAVHNACVLDASEGGLGEVIRLEA